jgi:hypothetical protein
MNKSVNLSISKYNIVASSAPAEHYITTTHQRADELLDKLGFLIVRNAVKFSVLAGFAESYFSLFDPLTYTRISDVQWRQNCAYPIDHGIAGHPANNFVRSQDFVDFLRQTDLYSLISALFPSSPFPLPRVILRCFSNYSSRSTMPHRDREYLRPSQPQLHKGLTVWLSLTPVDVSTGQLVYLPLSSKAYADCDKHASPGRPLSIENIPDLTEETWLVPRLEYGDLLIHNLDIIHSSFTPKSRDFLRLSLDLRFVNNLAYSDHRWLAQWSGDDAF